LLVLVGPYWNPQYDAELWAGPEYDETRVGFGVFNRPGDDLVLAYNAGIAELAARHEALFVDVYHAAEGATWLIHADACHYSDVGQWFLGQTVFGVLAANCSFLSLKSRQDAEQAGFRIPTTGGTQALPPVIQTWRQPPAWGE